MYSDATEAAMLKDLSAAIETLSKFTDVVFREVVIKCSWRSTMQFCRLSCGKLERLVIPVCFS
jgi:hypothetical protein